MHTRRAFGRFICGGMATLLVACGGGGSDGPAPRPIPPAPAAGTLGDARLPEILEWARASQELPAMSAAVIRDGQIVERAAVGLRSADASTQVTTTDRWHLGSITKSMTATLAALLVEDGLIEWDSTPVDVWPELANDIHPGFRDITLRQLLSHTSGMKRDDEFSGAADNAAGTPTEKRRRWAADVLEHAPAHPDRSWSYSNVGYIVAGAMLETRAQTPWESLLQTRIFAPLGMTRTGFGAPGTANLVDEPWGHWSRDSGYRAVAPGPDADNPQAVGPAGRVHSTLDDMARYLIAHMDGERGVPGLLTVESFAALHTPVSADYALGWWRRPVAPPLNAARIQHDGTNGRWFAQSWFAADRNAALVIFTNGGGERGAAAISAVDQLMRERIAASP
jgi:CubicO group peptidase (beta-lactamase class C family)